MLDVLVVSVTISGGVLAFVMGQIAVRFFIDPIHDQKVLIGRIAEALSFYADVVVEPRPLSDAVPEERRQDHLEKSERALNHFRELASQLLPTVHAVPWYGLWSKIPGLVPDRGSVRVAYDEMIGISNSWGGGPGSNEKAVLRIRESLQIHHLYPRHYDPSEIWEPD